MYQNDKQPYTIRAVNLVFILLKLAKQSCKCKNSYFPADVMSVRAI